MSPLPSRELLFARAILEELGASAGSLDNLADIGPRAGNHIVMDLPVFTNSAPYFSEDLLPLI